MKNMYYTETFVSLKTSKAIQYDAVTVPQLMAEMLHAIMKDNFFRL